MHGTEKPSEWVLRWAHLAGPGTVLDIACGHGRHMKWFSQNGCQVTGLDRSVESIEAVKSYGEAICSDLENAPWPLCKEGEIRKFNCIVVTNYLWRPLYSVISESLLPNGVLIYETFAVGNETVGKPSRPDFLLQPGELLSAFKQLRVVAYEDVYLDAPSRFVQRLVAVNRGQHHPIGSLPPRFPASAISLKSGT